MIFDLSKLAIIGLGSDGTIPKPDGNHLRWAFGKGMTFPEKGFHLYRRRSTKQDDTCRHFTEYEMGATLTGRFKVFDLVLQTKSSWTIVADSVTPSTPTLLAKATSSVRVNLPVACRYVKVYLNGFHGRATLQAVGDGRLLASEEISRFNRPREVVLSAPGITALDLTLTDAAIVRICYQPLFEAISDDPSTEGWKLTAQLTLPETFSEAKPRIFERTQELEDAFEQWIKEAIHVLTDPNDPTHQEERRLYYIDGISSSVPPGTDPGDKVASSMNILSLLLMGAMEPDFARMLGLAWVDQTALAAVEYDYLVIGYWPTGSYYAITYQISRKPAPALAPPTGVVAATFATPVVRKDQTGAAVGVIWDIPVLSSATPIGFDAIWYDIRGGTAGGPELPSPNPVTYAPGVLNEDGRIVVGGTRDLSGNLVYPTYYYQHSDREDGWWGYSVKGFDIFGRESTWSAEAYARVLDRVPPPAPRLFETLEGGIVVHVPVQARFLADDDPGISTSDRNLLSASGQPYATVVEWTWFAEQQDLAPDTAEFRIYYHPAFQSFALNIVSIGASTAQTVTVTVDASPPFNAVGGILSSRGNSFHVLAVSGTTLTVTRAAKPQTNGAVTMVDPEVGSASVIEAVSDPRKWLVRLHVEALASTPTQTYQVVIPGQLLTTSVSSPVTTGWIGVTAVDNRAYIPDDPGRAGPLGGRFGNESNIAVRARITAVDRSIPAPGPAPVGPVYATRADFYGLSRYTLTWAAIPSSTYHVWRATESAVTASDYRARRDRSAGTYYGTTGPFADDPGFAAWLLREFSGLTEEDLLAATPSVTAEQAWQAWRTRYYDRDALSDAALQGLADRSPNERAFTQLTSIALTITSLDDTLDGRVTGRYLYKVQGVNPNGLVGPLGATSTPVHLHDVVPPRQPVVVKALAGDRSATIAWAANTERDLDHYELYRAVTADGIPAGEIRLMDRVGGDLPTNQLAHADSGLTPGQEVDYVLVAVDVSGNKSVPSLSKRVKPIALTAPNRPTISANRSPDLMSVLIDWTPPEAGTRALVERSEIASGTWQVISGWLPVDQSAYVDSAPLATPAAYRIKVQDVGGNLSAHSTEVVVN